MFNILCYIVFLTNSYDCSVVVLVRAFGISILELATGFTPFQMSLNDPRELYSWSDNELRSYAQEFTLKHFSSHNYDPNYLAELYSHCYLPIEFLDFLNKCLQPSRFDRPNVKQLLTHQFFTIQL